MSGVSFRILIVEDQFLIAKQVELILVSAGHEVVGLAATSAEALRLAAETEPDLALVDLSLADGVTGMAVARYLVEETQASVIFTTANVRRLPADYCGAIGVIEKPFTKIDLVAAMNFVAPMVAGPSDASQAQHVKPQCLRLSPVFEGRRRGSGWMAPMSAGKGA